MALAMRNLLFEQTIPRYAENDNSLYTNKMPADSCVSGLETLCAGNAQLHRRQRALRVMMAMMVPGQHEEIDYWTARKLSTETEDSVVS